VFLLETLAVLLERVCLCRLNCRRR